MSKIENVSWGDIFRGHHRDPGENAILIQIIDPKDPEFPTPKSDRFTECHQFRFLDAEVPTRFFPEEHLISDEQATEIYKVLMKGLDENRNVVVHCVMGVCRSGAVVEVAESIGYDECPRHRLPNTRVKGKLLQAAGLYSGV